MWRCKLCRRGKQRGRIEIALHRLAAVPARARTASSGERQSTPMTSTSRSATASMSAEPWLT